MDAGHVPSCAFSVINGSEVFYSKSYGEQHGTDRVYYLLSISKTIASTAILAVQEQGIININNDINNYLPFEIKHPLYPNTTITIKHLMAHQSGFITTFSYWEALSNGTYTWPEVIYEFLHVNGSMYSVDNWCSWEPGTSTEYSGAGTSLGVYIIEQATGKSYHQIVTETILTPLGMLDTKMDYNEYPTEQLTTPYIGNGGINVVEEYLNTSIDPGGAGYWSTVGDMSKFMIAHMNQGNYNGTSILTEASIDLMHTPLIGKYALGWLVREDGRQGHTGGPGFGYYSYFYNLNGIAVIYFCNQGGLQVKSNEIIDLIWSKANILLTEKTCEKSPFILPVISVLAALIIIQKYRKRDVKL